MSYTIRPMAQADIDGIYQTFVQVNKTREQFERYWRENLDQKRITLIAEIDDTQQIAAYTNLVWQSAYSPFQAQGIPEINDMHVIDAFQRQGIATALIKALERIALIQGNAVIGIGFGLTANYGNAQRLYPKLGYIPDGRGAFMTPWGDVLFLTKRLPNLSPASLAVAPPLPIQTACLTLRPFEMRDVDAVLAYHSLPEVVRYMYWQVRSRAEVVQVIKDRLSMTQLLRQEDRLQVAVALRDSNTVIGEVVLMYRSAEHQQAELGFAFNPAYQGQGYAKEAVEQVLAIGFREYHFHRIYGQCDVRNTASYKLLERLGMRREAHFIHNEIFKGEWGDELVYAILREEWLERVQEFL